MKWLYNAYEARSDLSAKFRCQSAANRPKFRCRGHTQIIAKPMIYSSFSAWGPAFRAPKSDFSPAVGECEAVSQSPTLSRIVHRRRQGVLADARRGTLSFGSWAVGASDVRDRRVVLQTWRRHSYPRAAVGRDVVADARARSRQHRVCALW